MKLSNVFAVMWNDVSIIKGNKSRLLDIIYFPIITSLIWGLYANYTKQYAAEAGLVVLISNLYWTYSQLAQQQTNFLVMEDMWSMSIRQILVSGITEYEYITAKLLTTTVGATFIGTILLFINQAFGAPLITNLPVVVPLAFVALLGSLALAIVITGTVIAMGREYQFLTWSTLELFVFFSAPFYPASSLPWFLAWISKIMPFTYLFEGARTLATGGIVTNALISHALLIAAIYFILAWPYFTWCFKRARRTGQLARITS